MKLRTQHVVILLALGNVAIHLAVATNLEYHRDELLYFSLGKHPALGYPSVPPLIAWLAALVRTTLGSSVLAVKFLPAVLGGVFILLIAAITRTLGGSRFAVILAAVSGLIAPVFLRTFHLFQPVHLDLLFWSLLLLLAARYLAEEQKSDLLLLGVVAGSALLNKYLVVLLLVGLVLGLAHAAPRTFGRRPFWAAVGIMLLIISPNLWWQFSRGFPVFDHLSALKANQLVNVGRGDFLIQQLLMSFAAAPLLVTGCVAIFRYSRLRWLAIAFTVVVGTLLLLRGKPYYTIGLFPALIAVGAIEWERLFERRRGRWAAPVVMSLLTLPVLPLGLPVTGAPGLIDYFATVERMTGATPDRRFEDGSIHPLPQDYADQLGWTELVWETATACLAEPNPSAVYLYCSNYGQAGAMTVIGQPLGLPQPISFSDAFNTWVPRGFDPPLEVLYYTNDELGEDVAEWFGQHDIIARIDQPLAREAGTTVWRLSSPRRPFREFWRPITEDMPSPY